jgi:hypothetical protein
MVGLFQAANGASSQPSSPSLEAIPDLTPDNMYATVNALVQTVRHLSGQTPEPSRSNPVSKSGSSNKTANATKKDKKVRFSEQSRQTEDVTITDRDSGATLTYTQITKLVMQDSVTGETWTWTL